MNNDDKENINKIITELSIAVALLKAKADAFDKVIADVQVLKDAKQQALGERTIMVAIAIFIGGLLQAAASAFFSTKH